MLTPRHLKAFTLIELLIVVAIIAILAAIAVPNFLEAQTRAKVSRAKADMRSLATAVESYYVDNNSYPKANNNGTAVFDASAATAPGGPEASRVLERLTTPVAYITSVFEDPFLTKFRSGSVTSATGDYTPVAATNPEADFFKYFTPGPTGLQDVGTPTERARWYWLLQSNGPDLTYINMGGLFNSAAPVSACVNAFYDPTNGTISRGSIFRLGGSTTGEVGTAYGAAFYQAGQAFSAR
jgi:type II secretion system protein G